MPRLLLPKPKTHWHRRDVPELVKMALFGTAVSLVVVWLVLLNAQTHRMRLAVEDLDALTAAIVNVR